jgi:hypothetical protein
VDEDGAAFPPQCALRARAVGDGTRVGWAVEHDIRVVILADPTAGLFRVGKEKWERDDAHAHQAQVFEERFKLRSCTGEKNFLSLEATVEHGEGGVRLMLALLKMNEELNETLGERRDRLAMEK